MTQTEQVTMVQSGTNRRSRWEKHKLIIYKLGISEVVFGAACCMVWLASLVMAIGASTYCIDNGRDCYYRDFVYTYSSPGIWCGIFPIISGALGICMKRKDSICMLNTNMAMSIVSAAMMGVLIVMSPIAATSYEAYLYPRIIPPHILLGIFGLAAMVLGIVHSAFCCAGACCHRKDNRQVVYTAPPQQYVQLPNGQLMLVHPQQNYPVPQNQHANFQPAQVVFVAALPPGSMVPSASAICPTQTMPVTPIPSQATGTQPPMEQAIDMESKQNERSEPNSPNPPGYDA